jgi:hypothetical protein
MVDHNVCLLLFFLIPHHTVAFGPGLESVKGAHRSRTNRFAISDYDDHDRDIRENLNSRNRAYTLHYETIVEKIDGEFFHSRLFVSEPFYIDSTMFGIVNPFDVHVAGTSTEDSNFDTCSGDDCVECAIPEEYKFVGTPIDVMAYLGIKRAESIRVVHQSADWT